MPLIKRLKQHALLLDTHIWIWLVEGSSKIKPFARKAIEDAETLFISPISIWEFGMLVEHHRVEVEMDRLDWIERSIIAAGLEIAPINPRVAIQSTRLPGEMHGDPADRLLVATAHEISAVLVTCERKILQFGRGRFITAFNPG